MALLKKGRCFHYYPAEVGADTALARIAPRPHASLVLNIRPAVRLGVDAIAAPVGAVRRLLGGHRPQGVIATLNTPSR